MSKKKILSYSLILLVLLGFVFIQTYRVSGDSMNPNFTDGDLGISLRYIGQGRFDTVIVRKNGNLVIKRVIGLPNEKVEYKNNYLYINDNQVTEPFKRNSRTENFSIQLKENEYFVLGDNRERSLDSRSFGAVPQEEIISKVILKK